MSVRNCSRMTSSELELICNAEAQRRIELNIEHSISQRGTMNTRWFFRSGDDDHSDFIEFASL
ncbi:MAG: hypothetical protein LCH61_18560 [Proteobacteria bacterium]|nr:hypothetical protein [Pseudomonadota bacterium]